MAKNRYYVNTAGLTLRVSIYRQAIEREFALTALRESQHGDKYSVPVPGTRAISRDNKWYLN